MPEINFKISDGQKYEYLWSLLNPNYNEAGDYTMEYVICEVYDEYAVVRNLAENIFERVYYTKNDETDSLEITEKERCYFVDINQAEKDALDNLHANAGSTFAEIGENYSAQVANAAALNEQIGGLNAQVTDFTAQIETLNSQISDLNTQISEFVAKIAEHEASIATLNTENETLNASLTAANETIGNKDGELTTAYSTITTLTSERDALVAYKNEVIKQQKTAIITSYTAQLPEEVIEEFLNNLDNYSLEQLDMVLTYEQKKHNPTLFAKQAVETPNVYIPKDDGGAAKGISDILAKYQK